MSNIFVIHGIWWVGMWNFLYDSSLGLIIEIGVNKKESFIL